MWPMSHYRRPVSPLTILLASASSSLQVKESLLATGIFKDNVVTHILSGLGAGFFAVCLGSPVDVVKSRVMGRCNCPHSLGYNVLHLLYRYEEVVS